MVCVGDHLHSACNAHRIWKQGLSSQVLGAGGLVWPCHAVVDRVPHPTPMVPARSIYDLSA
jgi:hypothetical protein